MTDCLNRLERSRRMARIRSEENGTTELRFIRMLRKYRITRWRRKSKLPGKPDFVFAHCKLAVFLDGDFWHGNPQTFRMPKTNRGYWTGKIQRNRSRDRQVNRMLKQGGWRVIRFWESSLRNEEAIMRRLIAYLS